MLFVSLSAPTFPDTVAPGGGVSLLLSSFRASASRWLSYYLERGVGRKEPRLRERGGGSQSRGRVGLDRRVHESLPLVRDRAPVLRLERGRPGRSRDLPEQLPLVLEPTRI